MVSIYTVQENFTRGVGYSESLYNIVTSLNTLGYQTPFNDHKSTVQFNFCQPPYFADEMRPDQHKISLLPWESTEPLEGWLDILEEVDEIWATSDWCYEVYQSWGLNNVTNVYPHGVNEVWKPLKRTITDKVKFLHIGEPAPRKGGKIALEAFRAAFPNEDDVELIIKTNGYSTVREKQLGNIKLNNVRVINFLDEANHVALHHRSHFMVYPSWGEGFGLHPLEGLATGMPVICTGEWAHYKDKIGSLTLDCNLVDSPWPDIHPGKMLEPSFDDLVEKYRYCYNNADSLFDQYYKQSFKIHKEYDWINLTKKAFKNIEK